MFVILLALFAVGADFQQGMWVRGASLAFADSLPHIMEIAEEMEITDVYAQVVVGGYAYYNSRLLPKSQYLCKVSAPDFDPLDSLIRLCHEKSIRVHAWINTLLAWSLETPPESLSHIYYTHPEWFIMDIRQRSMREYTYQDWKGYNLEGLYLDPAKKEVREYLASIGAEILSKYPVDGIHLDFVRYPGTLWGLPDNEKTAVFAGLEADTLRWLGLVRYARLNLYIRWMIWQYYKIAKEREFHIQATAENMRQAISTHKKTDLIFSAAVFGNPASARFSYCQPWWNWHGTIDYPVIMSYTQDIGLFNDYVDYVMNHRKDAIFGIGILWPGMEDEVVWQMRKVKEKWGPGIAYFDYKNLDTLVDRNWIQDTIIYYPESLICDSVRYKNLDDSRFFDYADIKIDYADEERKLFDYTDGDTDYITRITQKEALITRKESLNTQMETQNTQIEPRLFDYSDNEHELRRTEYVDIVEELEFATFLLSLSLNPARDLQRMGLSQQDILRIIADEVKAFKYFDQSIFPIGDTLIEPEKREVVYELVPWLMDSLATKRKALRTKKLTKKKTIFPWAMDKFARTVFSAGKGKKELCITQEGIYIFKVQKIHKGGKKIGRDKIRAELVPIYLNWTIKKKFAETTELER